MNLINSNHSAAPVWASERVRVTPPISTVQGTGLPFAGYGAVGGTAVSTPDMTLGGVRKAAARVPARGRPL